MREPETWFETNRARWDERVPLHVASDFYDVDGFLAGACPLREFERAELGDVRGLELVHPQCHFGLDTLAWARRGARVTGLDFVTVVDPYFHDAPLTWEEPGTYTDLTAPTQHNRSFEWNHGIGAVVSAVLAQGLRLELLHEHDHTLFPRWPFLERRAGGTYHMPAGMPALPLMYSLLAVAP